MAIATEFISLKKANYCTIFKVCIATVDHWLCSLNILEGHNKTSCTMFSEHLPRLQPRPYSACSSPLRTPNAISFAFNVVEVPAGSGRVEPRKGVCTGWLEQLVENTACEKPGHQVDVDGIGQQVEDLKLKDIEVHNGLLQGIKVHVLKHEDIRVHDLKH